MMLVFISQKLMFMIYNHSMDSTIGICDYLNVMWHGIPLDMTTTGYLLVYPLLVLIANFFIGINLRQWLVPYFCVIFALLSIIFVADTVMYEFWQFKLDTTVFLYTDKPADAVASVSTTFVIFTILAIILLTIAYSWLFWWILPKGVFAKSKRPLLSLIMIPVAGIMFIMIRGGIGEGTANVTNAYFSGKQFLNHSAVNSAFNMFYSISLQQDYASEYQYFDDKEEVNTLLKDMFTTESIEPDTLLKNQRPDIILVVWEGCGASFAGCVGGEGNITPNLDKLAEEGVLFTNCYANSFRTDRGLVCINSGWLGLPSASLMKLPRKCEKLPGLARTLSNNGYNTSFWYGGDISFTNMGGFMLQNGYQKTFSDKDFPNKEKLTAWGVPDGPLFDKALEGIKKAQSPFFTSILTLSSHEPWEVPYQRLDNNVENSFAYTDDCLGKFVEGLKAANKWDNTLLIIIPDHGAIGQEGRTVSSIDVVHIPLLFTGGAIKEKKTISTIMNQSDFAATLLGQLHLKHDEFIFSRDVMSKSYTYPTAIHCSKIAFTFCDSTGISTYDLEGNMTVQDIDSIANTKEQRVKKGKAILQNLYTIVGDL